ncbi:FAD-dependent oxidoreductase [Paenibacillus spongiae]|uniref:FAD-dependent oxidoreductase n=1 Tax=Paenibacillus spongiae TaxID=2909671 RepID=A0ABY5SGS0_9BACL|nr:FAD-dependent oxidoreductase [Paenibacillus spongiae]UVI33201.1 FAD-dependent oxidoreductase [Paenibacillus spongiae]
MIKTNTEITDVVVLGGGAAGVMAAAAAARNGAKVLLVEGQNCLGGSRTATGVDTFYGFFTPGKSPKKIVGGIPDEIVNRLKEENKLFERQNTYGAGTGLTYDVEALKIAYEDLVQSSGCQLLFHTTACHVEAEDGRVSSVWLANKAGITEVKAKYFVDTTGDADIVARAGGRFDAGSESEPNQSLSTIFFMGNVDLEKAKTVSHEQMVNLMKEANESKEFQLPRIDGSYHRTPNPGVIQANMVRVKNIDATDPYSLTKAEIEGRKQVQQYANFLKAKVAGFENAFLMSTSQYIGVRETRKIEGHYVLTEDDVVSGRKFKDSIACCGAPVEDHNPGEGTRWVYVADEGHYHIPYRSLVPQKLKNVIVAGRCLSATHGAQASARNSAQAMAMGQAAGTAAAIAFATNRDFADVDIDKLRQTLAQQHAIID